jgi:hypothetical protein
MVAHGIWRQQGQYALASRGGASLALIRLLRKDRRRNGSDGKNHRQDTGKFMKKQGLILNIGSGCRTVARILCAQTRARELNTY